MQYIHRTVEKRIEELEKSFLAILITGARQSGKSTLLQYVSSKKKKKIKEVSLDDLKERELAINDPEGFLRMHGTPLIIDEFQYAPNLLSYIKISIDEEKQKQLFDEKNKTETMYYLTGSQTFVAMQSVTESLAGRIGIIDLFPLSNREINNEDEELFVPNIELIKNKKPLKYKYLDDVYERIFRGSYPELYKNNDINIETYFSAYVRTYIERDVRNILNIQNEPKFLKFISCVAARTGQEYNASDIAKDVGIDSETATKWIGILSNTYLVYLLQPHTNNNISRIVKRPKIYFMDTGLACYLTGYISAETLKRSAYSGQIFETYIVSEIIKNYANNGKDPRLHLRYYRDNNAKEIDLLIVNDDNIYPIEIKKNANPGKESIKNFNVVKRFEMNSPNGIVLCLSKDIHLINENNYIVPIEYV